MTEQIISSPCIGVCVMEPGGNCKGCYRTESEISDWYKKTNEEKSKIVMLCKIRGAGKQYTPNVDGAHAPLLASAKKKSFYQE